LGVLVGGPSLIIRDDYFVIATFAFQVIIFSILNNWTSFTGGPMGLPGIPPPVIFGLTVSTHLRYLLLVLGFCLATLWLCHRLIHSPFGRILQAIREDEVLTQAAGKNVAFYKICIFVIAAALAAIAGVLYAHYLSFIDPTSFTVMESIFVITLVIIGGAGSFWGPVIGAVVLVTLPEVLRFLNLPSAIAANLRQIFYGSLLVIFMLWRPQGLLGNFAFQTDKKTD
jgi:branched-chain amino acid transport system permease protein